MLSIEKLTCHYGVICALDDVSINVEKPCIYAVIGVNGAGKSTLINTICGIIRPTYGSIMFEGEDLTLLRPEQIVRRGIVVCPEGRQIFRNVTVFENLLAGAYVVKDKKRIEENIQHVYDLFPRIKERRKQIAGTLSGGELQMLAIGRALMSNPRFLLLDEPSMGLAPNLIDFVFETLEKIHKERTLPIILVEQNSEMALSISSWAYVLEVGKVVLEGTGQELLNSDEVRNKYLGV